MDSAELEAVRAVLERRSLYRGVGLEPPVEVDRLEALLAERLKQRHALALNSGTSAVAAALHVLGVGAGDEVVIAGYTWLTDVTCVVALGAVPVLAPVGADLNLDPERLHECLSERTRAVIAVDSFGQPCALAEIRRVCAQTGRPIAIIDDACQAIGAEVDGVPVGVGADLTVFSFQSFKPVAGGEGGALLTDDDRHYLGAVRYHDAGLSRFARGLEKGNPAEPVGIGFNLRMSELGAAVIRVQLERLPKILSRLKTARAALLDALEPALAQGALRTIPARPGVNDNGSHLLLQARSPETADAFCRALATLGAPTRPMIEDRLHTSPGYADYLTRLGHPFRAPGLEETRELLRRTVVLQINWELEPAARERIQAAVLRFAEAGR